MSLHVVLIKFTEKGFAHIAQSPDRAAAFRASAEQAGVTVTSALWTTGPYDGILVLEATDPTVAAGVVLRLSKGGNVSTVMLQAFDADGFREVLSHAG